MAIYYATPDDLNKLPYQSIAGSNMLDPNSWLYKGLLKKANNNPLAGSIVRAPVTKDSLAPGFMLDPDDPTKAYKFGIPGGGSGFDTSSMDDFLKQFLSGGGGTGGNPGSSVGGDLIQKVLGGGLTFGDRYKAPAPTSDKYFEDLMASITGSGPSSAEQAIKSVEGQGLEQLLAEIDRDTAGQVASSKLDYLDRGIGGPGQMSDIEANAIAQLQTGGARTKAGAKTSVLLTQLGRQAEAEKEKEKAKAAALGMRYQTGAASDEQAKQIAAQGALSESQILASLLGEEYKGGITLGEGARGRESDMSRLVLQLLTSTGLKRSEMSQQDKQFYDQLMADAENAAMGWQARTNIANISKTQEPDEWMTALSTYLDLANKTTTLTGNVRGKKESGGVFF